MLCQIVHIVKGGQPVRMSKRAGTYVTLRDLLEEVGKDAVRFTMLTRKADAQMEFDLDRSSPPPAKTRCSTCSMRTPAAARCSAPRPRCFPAQAISDQATLATTNAD